MWKKLLLFSFMIVAAVSAGATTVVPVDLAAMADRAELIFVGTVTGIESVPVRDGSFAFTYVTFDVEQALKGISRGGKTITLRIAGGESETDVFEVSGAPSFWIGGKHLLFVEGNDRFMVPLVGWSQGKLDIVAHPVTRQPMLVDDAGRAVDGVTARGWRRNGMRLNKDGSLKQPETPGVSVVSQEGVRIEVPRQQERVDRAEPAGKVLGELRAYIHGRKATSKKFKDSQFADSASKSRVPDTYGFTAVAAPSASGSK